MTRTLAHTVTGEGTTPVMLLHGFLGSGRNLSSVARRLTQARPELRVVTPDLTGHGASPALPPNANLETLAQDVLALAHALGFPTDAAWIGHSLGGRVALQAHLLEPAQVRDITLLDIPPGPMVTPTDVADAFADAPAQGPDRAFFLEYFTSHGVPDGLAQWLMMNLTRSDTGFTWKVDRAALMRLRDASNHTDLWAAVENRNARVRAVRGGTSGYVTDDDVERLSRSGVVAHTIPNAGHFIHMDALDALMDWLLAR